MTATGPGRELTTLLIVAGAHLRGEPLHPSLLALGARFVRATRTAPEYRMVALPALDGAAGRPAVAPAARPGPGSGRGRGAGGGDLRASAVAALGRLMLTVAPPLAIGTVALTDGSAAPGIRLRGLCDRARHLRLRRVARLPGSRAPASRRAVTVGRCALVRLP